MTQPQGMRAALGLGDRATALQLYWRLEKVLENELGIAPQQELQDIFSTARDSITRAK